MKKYLVILIVALSTFGVFTACEPESTTETENVYETAADKTQLPGLGDKAGGKNPNND
jgi:hypothetical protein